MDQYYGVVHLKDGTIHLWPGDSQEECLEILRRIKETWGDRMKATTVIKRNLDNVKDGMIFGSPKSLDVMQEKNKKKKS